jgi:alkaline phosphatase D
MRFPLFIHVWAVVYLTPVGLSFGGVLTHGPVVGGVTDINAKVFVRTDRTARVQVRYSTDPTFATYSTSDQLTTEAASDFTSIIPLSNLAAETKYYLDITVDDVPQLTPPYPSFGTFPSAGSSRNFTFLVLTDFTNTKDLTEPTQAFASAAATNPVFAFIGGDFDHRNPKKLSDKRKMFKDLFDPNTPYMSGFVSSILRKMPIAHQWDDHDAGLNDIDKTYADWSLSQQAFEEYIPAYELPSVVPGIWQKFSYAQADFFVLDCRSQRDPANDQDGPDKSMLDGNNLGVSGELKWLKDSLLASTARWKIILTSVITNPTTKFPDAWAGYQTEWNSLKDYIQGNAIQGIVFISGDLHLGAIDNGSASGFPEMCVSQPNGNGNCPTALPGVWSQGYYDDTTCKGFSLVKITTDPDQMIFIVSDEFGHTQISYTFGDGIPTPTPTPTPGPPVITLQPVNRTVKVNTRARFSVTATGALPLQYQWQKNSGNIPGATSSIYVTPRVTKADNSSRYDVIVSNSSGSVTSNTATLTVQR